MSPARRFIGVVRKQVDTPRGKRWIPSSSIVLPTIARNRKSQDRLIFRFILFTISKSFESVKRRVKSLWFVFQGLKRRRTRRSPARLGYTSAEFIARRCGGCESNRRQPTSISEARGGRWSRSVCARTARR